jgi:shikimate dehydrogenase
MMDDRSSKRVCYLIGDPVAHSLSPVMHNAAFRAEGLDLEYRAMRVPRKGLGKAIDGLRSKDVIGLNVTIPHKSAVIPFLDDIDDVAKEIGAVNTIVNTDGSLIGHNTDWLGALSALGSAGYLPGKGKKGLVLGAGDSAKAVTYALAKAGMDLTVSNRDREKANAVSERFGKMTTIRPVAPEELSDHICGTSLIVNCTPLGMDGFPRELPLDPDLISGDMMVLDLVYVPMETMLIRAAKERGAKVAYGYEMLIGQGARSFELFTGRKAPVDVMIRVVLEHLKEAGRQ